MIPQQTGMSNLQLELLKLYAHNVSEQNLLEIRQLLAEYFAAKATEAFDTVWDQQNISSEDMNLWANEHNRR